LLGFVIAAAIADNLMGAVSEQTAFGGDYNVFNTGALVGIVNNDDFHCQVEPRH
jgi:hypothetical protein